MNLTMDNVLKKICLTKKINIKTLKRILDIDCSISPYARTVLDIYSFIYEVNSYSETLTKAPSEITAYIIKSNSNLVKNLTLSSFTNELFEQHKFTKDHTFNQIYIMAIGNHGTTLELIQNKFGENGLAYLDEMIKNEFLEIGKDERVRTLKILNWDSTIRQNISETILTKIFKSDLAELSPENYLGTYVLETTKETAMKIRAILQEAIRTSILIGEDSKPTIENAIKLSLSSVIASND